MRKIFSKFGFTGILLILFLTGCGPGQLLGPQRTATSTATNTPTATLPPTSTPLPTSTPKPTATPEPTAAPTSALPTYAQIVESYPAGTELCQTEADITGGDDNGLMLSGKISMRNMQFIYQCYGTKLTAKVAITLEGKSYLPGAKLTVDKDLNWVEVANWD